MPILILEKFQVAMLKTPMCFIVIFIVLIYELVCSSLSHFFLCQYLVCLRARVERKSVFYDIHVKTYHLVTNGNVYSNEKKILCLVANKPIKLGSALTRH